MTQNNKPHILVVEDDAHHRTLINHQLKDKYNLTFAVDAIDGARALQKPIDLALIDIFLGSNGTGMDFLDHMKSNGSSHIKTIALTAQGAKEDRQKYLDHGFDDYIPKPYNRVELIEGIERQLKK